MKFSGIDVGSRGMVFCLQNCSGLKSGKNCYSDREKKSKFEAEGREFAEFLRHF